MMVVSPSWLLLAATGSFIGYFVSLVIYRLFFHPLAKFPGPKLAGATELYEQYFDVVKRGMWIWEIEKMHEKYGPIVRINPDELHIKDSDYFEEIYSPKGNRKRHKNANWAKIGGSPTSTASTLEHDMHRYRRAAINPFFAKRSVVRLEPKIGEKVNKLCKRFAELAKTGVPFRLDVAFSALTTDVITEYCYGHTYNYLDEPDFKLEWRTSINTIFEGSAFRRATPWLTVLMQKFPNRFILSMAPQLRSFINFQNDVKNEAVKAVESWKEKKGAKESIFSQLLESSLLPPSEKNVPHLLDEGTILVAAGVETTAKALATTVFYVLTTPGVLQRLKKELVDAMPASTESSTLTQLEQLPYLSAVISEGIRLSYGVTTRSPRLADEPLRYKEWVIPPKTAVSEITYFVVMDPTIFPEPERFNPDRWLGETSLDHYLVNFGKGSRLCLGINLAYAEMVLTIAAIFRKFDIDLFETTIDDIRIERDFFVPAPKLNSKGVRAVVKGVCYEVPPEVFSHNHENLLMRSPSD